MKTTPTTHTTVRVTDSDLAKAKAVMTTQALASRHQVFQAALRLGLRQMAADARVALEALLAAKVAE